jgi:serine protease AprX
VLDSGISPHPDLDDRLVTAVSTVPNSPGTSDFLGHGTHVASLALGTGQVSQGRFRGVAPGAHLISIRVTSGEETQMTPEERYQAVVNGLEWATRNRERYNIRVVNLSMGYPLVRQEDPQGHSYFLDPLGKAIEEATRAGLVLVVAAGNDGDRPGTLRFTPATHPDVITVGSVDTMGTPEDGRDDAVARFSSRGPGPGKGRPDLVAPGVNLMGANVAFSLAEGANDRALEWSHQLVTATPDELHDTAQKIIEQRGWDREMLLLPAEALRQRLLAKIDSKPTAWFLSNGHPGYLALHGTSMSAPIVAGVVACMLEANPELTPAEVKEILKQTARPLPDWDADAQGSGVVDASAAIAEASRRGTRA